MSKYRPSFAQNQLQKHGWEEGKGLGRSENGIKSAIKVKVKNNKGGLGHDAGSEFTFHWWDHIFNKAANAIEVVNDKETDEVTIKKNENAKKIVPQLMYNKKPLTKSVNGKPLLYGTFVSGGTVSPACDSSGNTPDQSSDSESEAEEEYSTDLLDRTYKKTGLTGHKGARHGLKLTGKLKRIQEQEYVKNNKNNENIEAKTEDTNTDDTEKKIKKKKKKNKRKHDEENELCSAESPPPAKKNKKKKKKKKVDDEE